MIVNRFIFVSTLVVFPLSPVFTQNKKNTKDPLYLSDKWKKLYSYIPPRTITILEHTGADSLYKYAPRRSAASGFYISRTEVTNREYREFVHYVRDSIAHTLLGHQDNIQQIDWRQAIDWKDSRLETLMVSEKSVLSSSREIDPAKLLFKANINGKAETISIYPDTLVWLRDFNHSDNEPLTRKYFSKTEYENYPVVGVSIKQSIAFCIWKTAQLQKSLANPETSIIARLPTNTEWEAAAFVLRDTLILETTKKDYHYNFGNILDGSRVMIKGYKDDGFFYTAPVKSYRPGPFGVYDMKGNISEWTSSTIEEIMNAETKEEKKKTIYAVKGGAWNSPPFYLQAGACQFLHADESHSYLGFRYILTVY